MSNPWGSSEGALLRSGLRNSCPNRGSTPGPSFPIAKEGRSSGINARADADASDDKERLLTADEMLSHELSELDEPTCRRGAGLGVSRPGTASHAGAGLSLETVLRSDRRAREERMLAVGEPSYASV